MKILIAEDDLVSRKFLYKVMEEYGDCDLVVDGLEALDAFLMALKDKEPYHLICLDIMMPKADGVKVLKAIRDLEEQYGIASKDRVKIIMTTALAEAHLVRTAFEYGCEAYATKPIDTKRLIEVMKKLGLIDETTTMSKAYTNHEEKVSSEHIIQEKDSVVSRIVSDEDSALKEGYFRSVQALEDYRLEVSMNTGTIIYFDFTSRLNTARFGRLRDEKLFKNVKTDGSYLIFEKPGKMPVKVTASEFLDLVLIDRRI